MRNWKTLTTGMLIAMLAGTVQAQGLLGAVSPSSRSVQTGHSASAFATLINTGQSVASNCKIAPAAGEPVAGFSFQATDPATNTPVGAPDTGVDIAPGGSQTFVFSLTPAGPLNAHDVALEFSCTGLNPAPVFSGVNTLLLSASDSPVADVITISATRTNDGIVDIAGQNRFDIFTIAGINIGAADTFTVTPQSTNASAPVNALICETNPATGACLANPAASVTSTLANGAIGTYGIFILRTGALDFDPAGNRVRLRFAGSGALIAGQTGVAARGTGTDVVIGRLIETADGFDVNGVSFHDGAASYTKIRRGDASSDASALASGRQVRVIGTKATGEADTVAVDSEVVKGPVTALSADVFEVVGQPVLTDQNTIFRDRAFSALAVGDFVEVSGVIDAAGAIRATGVEYIAGGLAQAESIQVRGTVAANDPAAKTFAINNISVDYNAARLDDSLPGGAIADGQKVRVKSTQALNGATLAASKIKAAKGNGGKDGNRIDVGLEGEIEGFISAFVSPADFEVGGQKISAGSATQYRHGTVAGLALNVRIEVAGSVDQAGVLQASRISFRAPDAVELVGPVDAINLADRTVSMLGVTVAVRTNADERDERDGQVFNFDAIHTGDWLRAKGGLRGDTIVATKVRRTDPQSSVTLQGPASQIVADSGTMDILGDTIVTTASTTYQLTEGQVVDKAGFFSALLASDRTHLVTVKGSFANGTLTAQQLELEVED